MRVRSTDARDTIPVRDRIVVSEDDAAALLSISKPTFRGFVRLGLISPVTLPGGVRRKLYRPQDLEDFVASLPTATSDRGARR